MKLILLDVEHDRGQRQQLIEQMGVDMLPHSEEEALAIQRGEDMLRCFETNRPRDLRQLRCAATVDISLVKETRSARMQGDIRRSVADVIGKTELIIRGASPQDVIAYMMLLNGKHFQSTQNQELDVFNEIREVKNPHHSVAYYEVKTAPFRNRTFLSSLVWRQLSDQPPTFVWVVVPLKEHPSVRPIDEQHAVRAEGVRCARATLVGHETTRIEYVCWVDLMGHSPRCIVGQRTHLFVSIARTVLCPLRLHRL